MKHSNKAPKVIKMPATPTAYKVDTVNQSTGAKTSGVKMRGVGAATKGTMARGPMA
jgi:hypothetical protein